MPLTDTVINQGISEKTYWLHVRLENTGPHRRNWVMHHETSYLDNMTAFLSDNGHDFREIDLSDRRPFRQRPLEYRTLAFAHSTAPGEWTDVYLRLNYDKADSVSLNVHLWDRIAFERHVRWEHLLFGGYCGILVTLIVIALMFAVVMREATYLYYALFLAASVTMWALIDGFSFQFLFPESIYWQNEGFHISYLLFGITGLQFSRAFLRTAELFPFINRLIQLSQLGMVLTIVLRLLGNYDLVLDITFISLAIPFLFLPILGWFAYRKGVTYARWFALAWLIYSIGLVITLASAYTRIFNWGMGSLIYVQLGGLLESLFLLVALGQRLLASESDRRHALQLANHDPLTDLGNRRLMAQQYDIMAQRFLCTGVPVFLLMLDLDHFKALNDTYGHHAGDCILQRIADLLKRHCGKGDACIRLGGEEFAMLIQAPDQERARQIAERIRREFSETSTEYQGQRITHTLSIGMTPALTPDMQLTLQEAMVRADEALYRGKSTSRNCTTLYAVSA